MNINRLIIKGKQEGEQIYLIGFEDDTEQGFIAHLEHNRRWYPHSVHSKFGHSNGWRAYDNPKDKAILERVAQLKQAGD